MSAKKETPKNDINDDINWDYESYQGRSRRQVTNNENLGFYSVMVAFVVLIASLIYLIGSSF
jgi:hypothetical protein